MIMLLSAICHAEDIIVMRNGDIINAIVKEIAQTEIKYYKSNRPSGPLYVVDKKDVLAINYSDGTKDKFDEENESQIKSDTESNSSNNQIDLVPSEDNIFHISKYNAETPPINNKGKGNKLAKSGLAYWGVGEESIMDTDFYEISLRRRGGSSNILYALYNIEDEKFDYNGNYSNDVVISIKNKTKKPLYIDLSNSFRVIHYAGKDYGNTIYDSNLYSSGAGSNSGVSLGLGAVASAIGIGGVTGTLASGIGIGGGSSSSASTTYQMDRVLAVPPLSSISLPEHKVEFNKHILSRNESLGLFSGDDNFFGNLRIHKNELKLYNEHEAPAKAEFYITISRTPNFETYSNIPIYLYVRAIFGVEMGSGVIIFKNKIKTKDLNVKNPENLLLNSIE